MSADPLERIAAALERLAPPPNSDGEKQSAAWRWTTAGPRAVVNVDWVEPSRLVGVDDALALLESNTRRFVAGKPANDTLLWGDRGTGKSSLVKAMLTLLAPQGLSLIALESHQYGEIPAVSEWVEKRAGKYILFLDDLTLSPGASLGEIKTLLEGSVGARPPNLIVYATSNRRHLMAEYMWENEPRFENGEIHPQESVQEKIALSDRFGLRIGLYAPDQSTYLDIVDRYLAFYAFAGDKQSLHRDALRFALQAGHRSGRTAHQYVRSLDL